MSSAGAEDFGYGVTMHMLTSDRFCAKSQQKGVGFDDGLREFDHPDGDCYGGEYGPYMVPRWSHPLGGGKHSLVYLHSTWQPYKVSLMRAVLTEHGASAERARYGENLLRAVIPEFSKWPGTGGPFAFFDEGGGRWVTTYHPTAGGDKVMGAIWHDFQIDAGARELRFRVRGGHGAVKLYHRGAVVRETRAVDAMSRDITNARDLEVRWRIDELQGEAVRFVVEDTATDAWGFITVSPVTIEGDARRTVIVPAQPRVNP
jgi:hypothetical protein